MLLRKTLITLFIPSTVLLLVGWEEATTPRFGPHSAFDMLRMRSEEDGLVVRYSEFFATAGRCSGCHGHDTMALAMVDESGVDVNVADDWRSTMMANSARDPFFRAKVEHEVLVNPGHASEIENTCSKCHAPLGMHEERLLGNPPFTMAMLDTSVMGLEGVSCLACHQQMPDSAGHFFSGDLKFGPERHHQGENSARVYGPYSDDEINTAIMTFFVGFAPTYGQHIVDGRVCAGCHTLVTKTLDLQGDPTGGSFVEQATWHEWKNSIYPADPATTCRGCHMPRIDDEVILASEYAFLPGHSPFGLHHLAGGNTHMLRLLKENKDVLDIPATDTQFDSTIARSLRNLHESVDLDLDLLTRTPDTAFIAAHLVNLTGHKFPSGYPSRRAILELIVTDVHGDTLFHSGAQDETHEVIGHDAGFEPHYDVIRQPDQVQLYEMVMADVGGDVTTVLERAATTIKDNRLVPQGFSTSHYTYDTTRIEGVPTTDLDFNHDALGIEGNGGDVVRFNVPLNGYSGSLYMTARVYYQPVPPLWNAAMFALNGPRIDAFRDMLNASDGTPELCTVDSIADIVSSTGAHASSRMMIGPNPTSDGLVTLTGTDVEVRGVFNAAGQRVDARVERSQHDIARVRLPVSAGTYHLLVLVDGRERLIPVVRTTTR